LRRHPDALIVSYPKSGTTWLRYMLAVYMRAAYDVTDAPVTLRTLSRYTGGRRARVPFPAHCHYVCERIPWIEPVHDMPDDVTRNRPFIFLIRNPLDMIVSRFFHVTRHERTGFEGDIAAFAAHQRGLASLGGFINAWAAELARRPAPVVTYEAMKADPKRALRRVVRCFDLRRDDAALDLAVFRGRFDRMREVEARKPLIVGGQPVDLADAEAWRVRRGVVGGYADYLSPEQSRTLSTEFLSGLSREGLGLLAANCILPFDEVALSVSG
jgi:hypothetical protein